MSMRFHRHLTNTILTLSKKTEETNRIKQCLNDRIIKSYQNHPTVLKIKNKFGSDLNSFNFQQITTSEVKKLVKEIDIKKAVGVDTIPPKLIKIDVDIIAEPLTQAINCCLRQGILSR